jgi:hypothetical protein
MGFATVVSEETSNGGKPVVRVLLDSNGEERVFLRAFVTESDTPIPQAAKKARKPRKKTPKPEPISDALLIELSPTPAVLLDPVDIDELPDELKNEPEVADEPYTESV